MESGPHDTPSRARRRERARLVERVQHPNLVPLVPSPNGAGLVPVRDGSQRLADFGVAGVHFRRFELEHAIRVLIDVLNGLGVLHELVVDGTPFVHGAVSPRNIFIDPLGDARVLAFVDARPASDVLVDMSGYAAPEWLLGSSVDRRSDLFGVGALLWEALAGRRLFSDGSPAAVMARLASGCMPRLVPPPGAVWARGLCAVAERAISADPAGRYASAEELRAALLLAAGPRLSRRDTDAWLNEAPTIIPRSRRSAAQRKHTPPAVAIDLHRGPLGAKPLRTAVVDSKPVKPQPTRRRPVLLGLGAAAYFCLAWWLFAPRTPPARYTSAVAQRSSAAGGPASPHQSASASKTNAAAPAAAAPSQTAAGAAPALSPAPRAPTLASATRPQVALPALAQHAASAAVHRPPRVSTRQADSGVDYGI